MKVIHNPEHKIISFLDERFYFSEKSGKYYPSVTTYLEVYPKGFGFNRWLKELGFNADRVVQEASESGSRVHDAIDKYINGEQLTWVNPEGKQLYSLEEWMMILKAKEFFDVYEPETLANEISMLDEELGYGGTIDYVCRIKKPNFEGIWLLDFKSSNFLHKNHELQLAPYVKMWNRKFPNLTITRSGIMHLKALSRGEDKKGEKIQGKGWCIKEFERSTDDAYKLFEHTKAIWEEENPTWVPKNQEYPDTIQLKVEKKKS